MPRIRFTGEPAQAPTGYAIWEPGEEREVTERQAAELIGNVHYVRTDAPGPEEQAAPGALVVSRSPAALPEPAPQAPGTSDTAPAQGG